MRGGLLRRFWMGDFFGLGWVEWVICLVGFWKRGKGERGWIEEIFFQTGWRFWMTLCNWGGVGEVKLCSLVTIPRCFFFLFVVGFYVWRSESIVGNVDLKR